MTHSTSRILNPINLQKSQKHIHIPVYQLHSSTTKGPTNIWVQVFLLEKITEKWFHKSFCIKSTPLTKCPCEKWVIFDRKLCLTPVPFSGEWWLIVKMKCLPITEPLLGEQFSGLHPEVIIFEILPPNSKKLAYLECKNHTKDKKSCIHHF